MNKPWKELQSILDALRNTNNELPLNLTEVNADKSQEWWLYSNNYYKVEFNAGYLRFIDKSCKKLKFSNEDVK
jgi:hypothetical protein